MAHLVLELVIEFLLNRSNIGAMGLMQSGSFVRADFRYRARSETGSFNATVKYGLNVFGGVTLADGYCFYRVSISLKAFPKVTVGCEDQGHARREELFDLFAG